ncbi:alpha/beta hydrolase [Kiloniella laminariae]|uniref:alpha/beta hydrolase n=1 Tax=Kiloniella laminariae TaxID=454162 RepID=UPI00037BCAD2|nr:alpha/beta hydrolase [Kiloniella laminariae]
MHKVFSLLITVLVLSACQTVKQAEIKNPHGAFAIGDNFNYVQRDKFASDLGRYIPNPEETVLFIYNHGTENSGIGQECYPDQIPSYARAIVRQHPQTVLYYLCSQEIGVSSGGDPKQQRYFRRSTEISRILGLFRAHGVSADRTFLLGHSGGASTTLVAAADIPDAFNGFIVTAPGYGFAHTGKSRETKELAPHYNTWKAAVEKARGKPGLVYAFTGDTFAPPTDLYFMTGMSNLQLIIQSPKSCGISDFHAYPWSRCFRTEETPKIWNYIQQQLTEESQQAVYAQ